eukprot:6214284-Pleurochrysis_carterae.AAC.2
MSAELLPHTSHKLDALLTAFVMTVCPSNPTSQRSFLAKHVPSAEANMYAEVNAMVKSRLLHDLLEVTPRSKDNKLRDKYAERTRFRFARRACHAAVSSAAPGTLCENEIAPREVPHEWPCSRNASEVSDSFAIGDR